MRVDIHNHQVQYTIVCIMDRPEIGEIQTKIRLKDHALRRSPTQRFSASSIIHSQGAF